MLRINTAARDSLQLPAMGGPTVMGTDMSPSRNPMAWETSWAPTSSNAMGAMMEMKQPSKRPMTRQTARSALKAVHSGVAADMSPMKRKDSTWGRQTDRHHVGSPLRKDGQTPCPLCSQGGEDSND